MRKKQRDAIDNCVDDSHKAGGFLCDQRKQRVELFKSFCQVDGVFVSTILIGPREEPLLENENRACNMVKRTVKRRETCISRLGDSTLKRCGR
jgi:hypothetical protein